MAIQETRTLPAPFIDKLGTDLASQITAQAQVPVVAPGAAGITQLAGESAADFAARQQAAQQFDIRQQSLSGLAPTVAGLSQLEKDARNTSRHCWRDIRTSRNRINRSGNNIRWCSFRSTGFSTGRISIHVPFSITSD